MFKEKHQIDCPIFQKQENIINNIRNKINMAKEIKEKAEFAKELQEGLEVLLVCQDYNAHNLDCQNCHSIANLRKYTAHLIIKAKKLG